MSTATVVGEHAWLKIRINGKLHFSILRNDLLSIQSWRVDGTLFQIEYVTKAGIKLRTDYDDQDLWLSILDGLDKIAIALDG